MKPLNKALRAGMKGNTTPALHKLCPFILKSAYREFEERVGQLKSPKGAKTELIKSAIYSFSGEFSRPILSELVLVFFQYEGYFDTYEAGSSGHPKSLKKWSACCRPWAWGTLEEKR